MNHGLTNSTQICYMKRSRFIFSSCEIQAELLGIIGTREVVNVRTRLKPMLMEECLEYSQVETTSLGSLLR
jgi:hypothetical protein